jgi:hypothetical protein
MIAQFDVCCGCHLATSLSLILQTARGINRENNKESEQSRDSGSSSSSGRWGRRRPTSRSTVAATTTERGASNRDAVEAAAAVSGERQYCFQFSDNLSFTDIYEVFDLW